MKPGSFGERVEIACDGGHGRTGTAPACIAVLDGVSTDKAVTFVREHYNPRAVQIPWQCRYLEHFPADWPTRLTSRLKRSVA